MPLINELSVVNACLHAMGESPLNSVDEGSPIVASALNSLYRCHPQEQAMGWWFNKEVLELAANTDGNYQVPADVLGIDADVMPPWLSQRGTLLYDNRVGRPYEGTSDIKCKIIRNVALDRMPYNAASLVQAATVVDFLNNIDADELKISKAEAAYSKAFTIMNAEHIRNVRANMLYQGSSWERMYFSRYFNGRDPRWS